MGRPDSPSHPEPNGSRPPEPIAVVGMACRLPGAADPAEFWRLLADGRDEITEIPADRFDIEAFYDPRPATPGKTVSRWGGIIGDVAGFDAGFFGIAPREAANVDPQQRILLELGWEAMEDAGELPGRLAGSATGVFIGQSSSEYEGSVTADPAQIDSIYMLIGTGRSVSSGRLSYALDLRGPSLTVDAACSSSLLATHLACQSIWSGESSMAFAGGINLILSPHGGIGFSQASMAAKDGRCKSFSAAGDGFVRSDGIAVVLLKPLSQAQADGNPVYATILGTATGNDGQSSGLLMTPGQAGQESVLRTAYRQAGVDPRQVQYVEAHGTGTVSGDPVEVGALVAVLGDGRSPAQPCVLGSVKSNIGHTEAAAGVAGLIKTTLSLSHRAIPASLHAAELNPAIAWDTIPFTVQQDLAPWPAGDRMLAGVSSFGISGTNVHIVMAGAPDQAAEPGRTPDPAAAPRADLLPLSARSPAALASLAGAYAEYLSGEDSPRPAFADICYTAGVHRLHHEYRAAVAASSAAEAARELAKLRESQPAPAAPASGGKVLFVFPGQGGQWPGMGQRLMATEPVFAAALERCAAAMEPYIDWSLASLIGAGPEDPGWSAIDRIQPALFAVQVALAELWRSWGITPDGVAGHSMGEVAAAHIAGVLTLPDAARIICRRSALMRRLSGQGAMALVALPLERTAEALADYDGRLSVAVCNSPSATVVSGESRALAEFTAAMEAAGVFCRPIEVDVASHSPQVDSLREDLLEVLDGLAPQSGLMPVYSTVAGTVADGTEFDAGYWMRNLRQPVLFGPAIEQAAADGYSVFLEISPHPVLLGAIGDICRDRWPGAAVLASTRRDADERTVMLESLGGLYRAGLAVAWDRLYPEGHCVRLPRYPWQHETHWSPHASRWKAGQSGEGLAAPRRRADGRLAHPLLGRHFHSASQPELHAFQTVLGPQLMSYLTDHRVQGSAVFPAAGYMEMALAAAEEVFGSPDAELAQVTFPNPLVLVPGKLPELRLELTTEGEDRAAFAVFSVPRDRADTEPVQHASGMLWRGSRTEGDAAAADPGRGDACTEILPAAEFYGSLHQVGLAYGPAFQGITEIRRCDGEAVASIRAPEVVVAETDRYLLHPAVMDACFQVLKATLPREPGESDETDAVVLAEVGRLRLGGPAGPPAHSHARLLPTPGEPGRETGDIIVTDEAGQLVMAVEDLVIARIDRGSRAERADTGSWLYTLEWEQADPQPAVQDRVGQRWLVLSDTGGTGEELAAALEAAGAQCVRVSHGPEAGMLAPGHHQIDPADPAGWATLLPQVTQAGPVTGIVHLWSLDIPGPDGLTREGLRAEQELGCTSVLHLLQALAASAVSAAPRLYLVTAGVQAVGGANPAIAVAQAPMWGLGRTLGNEHPELACTLVDLSLDPGPAEVAGLALELGPDSTDEQVALRGPDRHVARLVPRAVQAADPPAGPDPAAAAPRVTVGLDEPVELINPTPGLLDNLEWTRSTRRPPGPGEVEIEIRAVGLNFNDVLLTLEVNVGQAPGAFLVGYECSGVISAVGPDVTGFAIGQEVICGNYPCFRRYLTTLAVLVQPKPANRSFEEAAAMPMSYGTAHHSLCTLARLSAGERVLIHAAATGVGLAAVRVAQSLGAEIFATAGTPEKRAFLRTLGVEHVLDSRTPAFADEIMALTAGQGVDVVLNSLAGTMLDRSLDTLAHFGRFVEIGKRDFYAPGSRMGMHHFQKTVSFFAVDLKRMMDERPAALGQVAADFLRFNAERGIAPLPVTVFGPDEVSDAFRQMAGARHTGKLVVSMAGRPVEVAAGPPARAGISADGTYLITGGLGGLGRSVATWLADQGARSLVLTGRRSPTAAADEVITALRERGVTVTVAAADITDEEQVRGVLKTIADELPPLRGVIHSAAVLDDGIIEQQTEQRLLDVLAPKVLGAWYLHQNTRQVPLDFFVLFSSAAALLGSPGQANYCAANTFLDALATLRRSQGLPALSIGWGAWAEVGLAAAEDVRGKRLATRGLASMSPEEGLDALGRVLGLDDPYVAVIPLDVERWRQFYPRARTSGLFDRIPRLHGTAGQDAASTAIRQAIESAGPGERRPLIESYLGERAGRILGFAADVDQDRSLQRLGLDSLMAVELRNAVETDLGVAIPVMNLLQGVSLRELAGIIADQLATRPDPAPETEPDLGLLSDQEVDDMLAQLEAEHPAGSAGA